MMLSLLRGRLERVFQGMLEQADRELGSQVEHLAALRDQSIVAVIGQLSLNQRFTMVDALRRFGHGGELLGLEGLEPKFASRVAEFATERRGLVTREKRRKALGTYSQIQCVDFDVRYFRIAKRALTHIIKI